MRLVKARAIDTVLEDGSIQKMAEMIANFDGVLVTLSTVLPVDWTTWTRAQKTQWAKDWLVTHASTHNYVSGTEDVFPDASIRNQAFSDFENFPNWATWTPAEAASWISTNVVDLASAKVALTQMAKAIIHLRDIVISRV